MLDVLAAQTTQAAALFGDDLVAELLAALLVAGLRIGDVMLNVFRTVFVISGRRALAALFHGLEGGVWLAAAGIVFADMTPIRAAGFIIGVSAGTYLGMNVVHRLRLGLVTVRAFINAREDGTSQGRAAVRAIHEAGHGATVFDGEGYKGAVEMVLSTVRRRVAPDVVEIIRGVAPTAFVAIDNLPGPGSTIGGVSGGRV